jgi:hypothetical protein
LFGVGVNRLYYQFKDSGNNVTNQASIITILDNQPPVFNCPADKTYYITGSDTSVFTSYNVPIATDNCDQYVYSNRVSGFGQTGFHPLGSSLEVWQATDMYGNTGTCSFSIIVRDSIAPVINCPDPVWFLADTGLSYTHITYPTPTATDNLAGAISIVQVSGKVSGDTAGIGEHTALWKATDTWGNVSYCTVHISVADREGPRIVCPNNVNTVNDNGACTATVNWTILPAIDNDLSYYTPTVVAGLPSGSAFPFGTTNVVYMVADAQNNRSYCSFNVTVVDNVAPVFTTPCPHDTTLNINPTVCGAYVAVPTLTASDNSCFTPPVGMVTGSASGYYTLGTTVQQYQIRDQSGNTAFCTYNVNVIDTFTLTITCPPNINRGADPGECTAYIPSFGQSPVLHPNFNFSCGTGNYLPNLGPYFPVGTSTVTYQYLVNNRQAQCSFTVTVVDYEKPQITSAGNMLFDIANGDCGKVVNFTEPVGTDNCSNGLVTVRIAGLASGSVFPVGVTQQTYVVADLIGQTDTTSFTITVRDTIAPVIVAPANVTASTDQMCGTVVTFTPPVGTDNSSCPLTTKIAGLNSGDLFPLGVTTEIYVVRDSAGNADTATFTVRVNPIYPLQSNCVDNVVRPDPNGFGMVVYYPVPGMVDQMTGQPNPCPGVTIALENGQGSGAYFMPGPHQESYMFIVHGTGDTIHCTTNVILAEFVPPIIDCSNTSYNLHPDSGTCSATFYLQAPSVTDGNNTGPITLLHQVDGVDDTNMVYNFSAGSHTITWHAIDYSGNSDYCTYSVGVADNIQIGNHFQGLNYCENDVVDLDPQIQGYSDSLTYQWIMDSLGALVTVSHDKILHFDRIKLTDQHQYNFFVTDRCGVTRAAYDIPVHVSPAPATTLTGLNSSYCIYDSTNVTVSFSPAGGVLSGAGVTGNQFNPRAAGPGPHAIEYAWYDNTSGCTGISTQTVMVYDIPQVNAFADTLYCINMPAIQLPATNSVYTGAGITGTTFNPATAGGGYHTITRTVTENGCSAQLVQTVHINAVVPNATITAPVTVCQKSGLFAISAATTGGVWVGAHLAIDSIAGTTQFNSRYTAPGFDTLVYSITQNGCTGIDTAIIAIKSNFYNLPYTFPQYCTNDTPVQFDTTDSKEYMGLGFTASGLFTPANVGMRGPVFYAVITTNNLGCEDTLFRMLNLRGGQLNVPNYQYVCQPGTPVTVNLGGSYDSIVWYNGSHSNQITVNDTGSYTVFLRDTMGCFGRDTLHVNLYTAPTQIITNTAVVACPNSTGIVTTDSSFIAYHWNNNAATPGIVVGPGTYTVTVTTSDGCQYVSPPAVVTNGADVTLPIITCAGDTTLYTPVGTCSISGVTLNLPNATDNCGLASVTSNAPSSYSVGTTNVTWTALDNSNNTRTCVQHVTVNDTIVPFFTNAPVPFLVDTPHNNCSTAVPNLLGLVSASDSCSGVTLTQSPAPGTLASNGLTVVTVTAEDVSGNTTDYFLYFQTQDTVKPVLNCPANMSVNTTGNSAVVSYTAPAGAVNCTNTTLQRIAGLGSGGTFPVGVNTETYVVTDGAGAKDTCSFTITVTHIVGINESTGNDNLLSVWPVPANEQLNIIYRNAASSSLRVKLSTVSGQLVISDELTPFNGNYTKTFDVSAQPSGTYILEIASEHEVVTRKIVKM